MWHGGSLIRSLEAAAENIVTKVVAIRFISSSGIAYPYILLVDTRDEDYAADLAQIQVRFAVPKHHETKKRRPRTEGKGRCM